ncbi:MAG: hypothetical protein Q4D71_01660 [Oscillospiraceae bacterium]|nr:hypothetical protein [Oscillospiraceae bacterium]
MAVFLDSITKMEYPSNMISFSGLLGKPTSYVITCEACINVPDISVSDKVVSIVYDGSDHIKAVSITSESNSEVSCSEAIVEPYYDDGELVIYLHAGDFIQAPYTILYTYGDSLSDIGTKEEKADSGSTSITFTELIGKPIYWSCIFNASLDASSEYSKTICVVYDGNRIYGLEMGSYAKTSMHWTASYCNGSLTISSDSVTQGGYFHHNGSYHLTYLVDNADQ